jgi:putative heme-binding domain-containing protein
MGDMNRGRIYRIAPTGTKYHIGNTSVDTPREAVTALQNPNMAVRHKAWIALHELGTDARPALEKLWEQKENPRFRARALWLLGKLPDGGQYIREAVSDDDPNIRITGLRVARQGSADLTPYLKLLVHDKSPQVRREAALALRFYESEEAADLWAELALQHDGQDRWYLEALGIAAEGRWDSFFKAWSAKAGPLSGSAAEDDIIWRARTSMAMPLLAARITDPGIPTNKKLRYFRAFDFQDPAGAEQKEDILIGLLNTKLPDREQITQLALNHLNPATVRNNAEAKAALEKTLASEKIRGTQTFVTLVDRYQLKNRNRELLQIMLAYPDSTMGTQAARLLLGSGGEPLIQKTLKADVGHRTLATLQALEKVQSAQSTRLIYEVLRDATQPVPLREQAVRSLGWGWGGDERLLDIVKKGQLPEGFEPVAAAVLSKSFRQGIREEAAKYLPLETIAGTGESRDIEKLLKLQGETGPGEILSQQLCQTCHIIKGKGHDFGPELSQIGSKLPREAIYESIIHPDAGISFGYEGSELQMKDGSTLVGIVYNETGDQVSLKMPAGASATIKTDEITGRTKMDHSMMPANLTQGLSEQQMANLVEYLYTLK